jgi:hypothetical protein
MIAIDMLAIAIVLVSSVFMPVSGVFWGAYGAPLLYCELFALQGIPSEFLGLRVLVAFLGFVPGANLYAGIACIVGTLVELLYHWLPVASAALGAQ